MKRWWRTVGMWWTLLCVFFLLAAFVEAMINYLVFVKGSMPMPDWIDWLPHWLTIPTAAVLWLLACNRILHLVDDLNKESLFPDKEQWFVRLRYKLLLIQAFVPLFLIALYYFAFVLLISVPSRHWDMGSLFLLSAVISLTLSAFFPFVWISALLAVSPNLNAVSWFWLTGAFGSWLRLQFYELSLKVGFSLPFLFPSERIGEYGAVPEVILKAAGFLLLLAAILLLSRQTKAGKVLAATVGLIGLYNMLPLELPNSNAGISGTLITLNNILAYLSSLADWNPQLSYGFSYYFLNTNTELAVFGMKFEFPITPVYSLMVIPATAVIGLAHYYLLLWLISRFSPGDRPATDA